MRHHLSTRTKMYLVAV